MSSFHPTSQKISTEAIPNGLPPSLNQNRTPATNIKDISSSFNNYPACMPQQINFSSPMKTVNGNQPQISPMNLQKIPQETLFVNQNMRLTNGGNPNLSRTASPILSETKNFAINTTKENLIESVMHSLPHTNINSISSSIRTQINQSSNLTGSLQNLSLGKTFSNGPVKTVENTPITSNLNISTFNNNQNLNFTNSSNKTQVSNYQAIGQQHLMTNNANVPNSVIYTATANQTPVLNTNLSTNIPVIVPLSQPTRTPLSIQPVQPAQTQLSHTPQFVQPPSFSQVIQSTQPSKQPIQSRSISSGLYPEFSSQTTNTGNQNHQQITKLVQQNNASMGYPSAASQFQQTPFQNRQPIAQNINFQFTAGQLQYQNQKSQPINQTHASNYTQMNVTQHGFNRLWGQESIDLMQSRHILKPETLQTPSINLKNQFQESVNCSADIMRCTLTKIPESNNLLQKSRLPLGILIHPFRDLNNLSVIQCATIVRCRVCRTYINPFVHFVDSKAWKCNLCYRVNDLPEEFQYDPVSKSYGDVTRRPEVRSSTIEFIAPAEYMVRPPQPAIYLFLFDVSIIAQQSGYLEVACATLSEQLENMPGDARTQVGFIAFNSELHFYSIAENYSQPHEITLVDIEDAFIPCPDNLLINLNECKDLIKDFLKQLPTRFSNNHDPDSALGAALQVAYKLMSSNGGRVTVFQTCLANKGPGALQARENPNNRSSKDVMHLNPITDFYKQQALECSGQHIAVDLFILNQQYCDLATISGVSKYSGGCIHHFPLYQKTKPEMVDSFKHCLERYLTRKIGFEAVMRVRCTRGLQIHTFHGNFFVRSTDLLSLPNVNPDAGFGMQISYDDNLTDVKTICFQAALLYTSSKGERRIRVHTLCLPVSSSLTEILYSADAQCIVGLLSKMAVDRSLSSSVSDARDAFMNATVDILTAFKTAQNYPSAQSGQLLAPKNLALLPLYISALLKNVAFRVGTSTRLDDRIKSMDGMKSLPLDQLIKYIYPNLYIIDCLFVNDNKNENSNRQYSPPLLQLTAEFLDSRSIFLLDCGELIIIYVGLNVPTIILQNLLGVKTTAEIPDYYFDLPSFNTFENEVVHSFIETLNEDKPFTPTIQIIRDTSTCRKIFIEKLVDDRSESSLSYYEFLQHIHSQIK